MQTCLRLNNSENNCSQRNLAACDLFVIICDMSYHVCPRDCYDSCGMILQDGKLVGDPNHPFTSGFTCGKAALSLRQVNDPARIKTALVRTKKGFEKISIEKALSIAAEKLSQRKVYRIDYSGHMGLLSRFFHQRLFRELGAPEVTWDICSTAGDVALMDGIASVWGSDIDAIKDSDFVIIWGANVAYSSVHAYTWAKQTGEVFVVDPVKTSTAESFIHVPVKPGGDVALALQILKELKLMGYEVPLSLDNGENLEKISGVSSETAYQLASKLANSRRPFVFIGYGFQRQWNGAMAVRLIASILGVVHQSDRFYYDRPYQGIDVDYVRLKGQKPNKETVSWTLLSEQLKGVTGATFFVLNANPLNTLPGRRQLIETFKDSSNYVIVHDLFMTESAQAADLVLPAKHYLEFEDVVASYGHKYLAFNEKGLEPPVDAMSNMELARELARQLELDKAELYETDRELVNGALKNLGIDYEFMKEHKVYKLPDPAKPGRVNWPEMDQIRGSLFRAEEGDFILLTPVARLRIHSQYDNVLRAMPLLEINPEDAQKLFIRDKDQVNIRNNRGALKVVCRVTDRVPRGVLRLEHGFWTDVEEPNVNDMVEPVLQQYGGGSQIMWTFVDIEKGE